MRKHQLVGITVLSVLLGACGSPAVISVPPSAEAVHTAIHSANRPVVASVEVENDAPPPKHENSAFGSFTLPASTDTAATVASDLKSYFAGATALGGPDTQRIRVRLEQADSYWTMPTSGTIPIIGLLTVAADREFFMNVRVSIEVEAHGKVIRTFATSQHYALADGKVATEEDMARSYRRLIAQYREQFFSTLDKTFTERYLD
jgi:hypothetical protein